MERIASKDLLIDDGPDELLYGHFGENLAERCATRLRRTPHSPACRPRNARCTSTSSNLYMNAQPTVRQPRR
jgi:hypothetical protein